MGLLPECGYLGTAWLWGGAVGISRWVRTTMAEAAKTQRTKPLRVGELGETYGQHPAARFSGNIFKSWAAGVFPLALF